MVRRKLSPRRQQKRKQERIVMFGFIMVLAVIGSLAFWLGPKDSPHKIMRDARKVMTQLSRANAIANGADARTQEPAATIIREYDEAVENNNLNKVMQAVVEMRSHLAQSDLSLDQSLGKHATYGGVCRQVDRLQRRMTKL